MPDEIPPWVVLVDTETVQVSDEGKQALLLGCYEVWAVSTKTGIPHAPRHKGGSPEPFKRGLFTDDAELYQLLNSLEKSRAVAHNWQFDASVIRLGSEATRRAHGYFIDMERGTSFPIDKGYTPFSVRISWGGENFTHFLDNTNFHKTSLANLGESFNMPKLDMPPLDKTLLGMVAGFLPPNKQWLERMDSEALKHIRTGTPNDRLIDVIRYCKRDVEVLREAWFSLFRFSDELAGVTPGITVASMSKRIYQRRWLPAFEKRDGEKFIGSLEYPGVAAAEEAAFHGGRTDVLWNGRPLVHSPIIRKLDVNSMYPSVMQARMPVQFLGVTTMAEAKRALEEQADGMSGEAIYLCNVTVSIPPAGVGWLGWEGVKLPRRGLCFPAGFFRCWAWQPMIAIAHEQGWIKNVHAVLKYRARSIFRQFVTDVYAMRKAAKEAGDGPQALLLKYVLNSLYGKFGQRRFGGWQLLEGADLEWQQWLRKHERSTWCRWAGFVEGRPEFGTADYLETEGKIYRFEPAEEGMGDNSIAAIAGYITAMARAKLWRAMAMLHECGHHVFMCDTDSIITDGMLPDNMVGKELGLWDLEETAAATACYFNAPKHYTFANRAKIKGVRNAEPGKYTYEQAQFSRWQTDLLSKDPERRKRIEEGAFVGTITKYVAGNNLKRVDGGEDAPNFPLVLPLQE